MATSSGGWPSRKCVRWLRQSAGCRQSTSLRRGQERPCPSSWRCCWPAQVRNHCESSRRRQWANCRHAGRASLPAASSPLSAPNECLWLPPHPSCTTTHPPGSPAPTPCLAAPRAEADTTAAPCISSSSSSASSLGSHWVVANLTLSEAAEPDAQAALVEASWALSSRLTAFGLAVATELWSVRALALSAHSPPAAAATATAAAAARRDD